MASFAGFSPDGLTFLAALPKRDPAWFKANKAAYERLIVGPTKAFVSEMGEVLGEERPDLHAEPKTNGSISPINNDLRFSPDKSPYKDHLLLRFWEGSPKKTAPTLFVRLSPQGIGFASGVVPADVEEWRAFVAGPDGTALAEAIAGLAADKAAFDPDIDGHALKRVPAPYPADHPRADLLRFKILQVRWLEPLPDSIGDASFVAWCATRLHDCLPLHRQLVEGLR